MAATNNPSPKYPMPVISDTQDHSVKNIQMDMPMLNKPTVGHPSTDTVNRLGKTDFGGDTAGPVIARNAAENQRMQESYAILKQAVSVPLHRYSSKPLTGGTNVFSMKPGILSKGIRGKIPTEDF